MQELAALPSLCLPNPKTAKVATPRSRSASWALRSGWRTPRAAWNWRCGRGRRRRTTACAGATRMCRHRQGLAGWRMEFARCGCGTRLVGLACLALGLARGCGVTLNYTFFVFLALAFACSPVPSRQVSHRGIEQVTSFALDSTAGVAVCGDEAGGVHVLRVHGLPRC